VYSNRFNYTSKSFEANDFSEEMADGRRVNAHTIATTQSTPVGNPNHPHTLIALACGCPVRFAT
jgi:hypothetical protein